MAVSDSSEEEFDRGTFADALQQRRFLSPQIQVSRPEINAERLCPVATLDMSPRDGAKDPVAKKPKEVPQEVEPVLASAKKAPPISAPRSWRFASMRHCGTRASADIYSCSVRLPALARCLGVGPNGYCPRPSSTWTISRAGRR